VCGFAYFAQKHLRELSEYSLWLLPPLKAKERRWYFARTKRSTSLPSSSFLLPFLLSFRSRWFSRGFVSMRGAGSDSPSLTFVSATQKMRGAPDVPVPRAQSTSNAYPRIHMRTCLMQMSFLPVSFSSKRSSARDGVH